MAKNKIITSQGNVQFINSKGKTISMHPMHCYAVYQDDTVSFLFIYMKEYSGQAFFASQFEDLEVDGETYDSIDALKEAIAEAFAKAGAQARTEIVDELPETGYTNTIYLLPKEHGEGYDEYIYNENEGWQLIGDTDIEFERYLEKVVFNAYSADTKEKIDYISGAVDDNASDIQFISGAVDTEIASREAADAVISGAMDTLSTNLANEVSRAQNAEQTLQNNINTVNSRVDAEQIARANADNAISGAVDSVVSDLASEVSRATAKENEIDSKVDGEISNREAADSVISGAVDSLSANLSLEAQRAQNAESALDSKINALSGESVTSGEVESMIDEAVSGKQDTLIAGENITIVDNVISASGGGVDSGVVETMIEDYMTTDVLETGVEYRWNINNRLGDLSIIGNNNYGWVNASMMEPEVNIVPKYDSNVDGSFGFTISVISSEIASKLNINSGTSISGCFILLIKSEYADTIPSEYKDDNNKCWIKLNQPITSETLTNDVVDGGIYFNAGQIESGIVGWSEVSGNTYHALMLSEPNYYYTIHKFNFNRFSMGQQAAISLTGKFDEIPSYMAVYGQYIGLCVVLDKNWQETSILTPLKSSDAANSFTSTTGKTIFNFAEEKTYAIEDLMADLALSTTSENPVQNKVITTALNNKQDTLVSGTNIKTINNTSILGSGNIDIGGGGVNVVQTTGTSTTDVMSQNAVTTALNNKQNSGNYWNLDAEPQRLTEATSIINENPSVQTSAIKIYGYDYQNRNFDNLYEFKYINGNPLFRNKYGSEVEVESYGNLSLVETSAITTSVTSSSTDAQIPSAKAVYDEFQEKLVAGDNITIVGNVISAVGGGSSYTAGRGIDITNDTISFKLPISAGTGYNCIAEGDNTNATANYSHAEGGRTTASGNYSHAEGVSTTASMYCSHAEGNYTTANGQSSHVEGNNTTANNNYEHASGQFNVSNSASTTFGDSGNTLFSVGNGIASYARHNAFEIRQNGDIYCSDGTNDVKLQDTITATASNTTALGGLSLVKLTSAEYESLTNKDSNTLYIISD